jgi:hypothetical protein
VFGPHSQPALPQGPSRSPQGHGKMMQLQQE